MSIMMRRRCPLTAPPSKPNKLVNIPFAHLKTITAIGPDIRATTYSCQTQAFCLIGTTTQGTTTYYQKCCSTDNCNTGTAGDASTFKPVVSHFLFFSFVSFGLFNF